MKILFCDFLFQKGNRHIDNLVIDMLAQDNEVFLAMNEDFICQELINRRNIRVLGNKYIETPQKYRKMLVESLKRMFLASRHDRIIHADIIYVSAYETRAFALGQYFFRNKKRIVVIENNNIDYLQFNSYLWAYKLYANKIHHMVFEELFKKYLCDTIGVKRHLIHVVPHIHYRKEVANNMDVEKKGGYDCIAISGSNDLDLVSEIVEIEKKQGIFRKNKIRCLIKSSSICYNSDYLIVSNRFIPTNEYNALYKDCKVVMVPFPPSYQYRMSGVIVDAFSNHKPVVSSNIVLAEFFASKYGSIIRTSKDGYEMINMVISVIREIEGNQMSHFDFRLFEKDHGEMEVKNKLIKMINEIGGKI